MRPRAWRAMYVAMGNAMSAQAMVTQMAMVTVRTTMSTFAGWLTSCW